MVEQINRVNQKGVKITIIGLKKSGYAAALLGDQLGATIFVSDSNFVDAMIILYSQKAKTVEAKNDCSAILVIEHFLTP